jgi:hypothetical protein
VVAHALALDAAADSGRVRRGTPTMLLVEHYEAAAIRMQAFVRGYLARMRFVAELEALELDVSQEIQALSTPGPDDAGTAGAGSDDMQQATCLNLDMSFASAAEDEHLAEELSEDGSSPAPLRAVADADADGGGGGGGGGSRQSQQRAHTTAAATRAAAVPPWRGGRLSLRQMNQQIRARRRHLQQMRSEVAAASAGPLSSGGVAAGGPAAAGRPADDKDDNGDKGHDAAEGLAQGRRQRHSPPPVPGDEEGGSTARTTYVGVGALRRMQLAVGAVCVVSRAFPSWNRVHFD